MKARIVFLLIALFISFENPFNFTRDTSIYYPDAISGEALLGGYSASIYPQLFGRAGVRYEFRRKSYTGFVTGLHFIFADGPGAAIPILMMGSFNEGVISLKFDVGGNRSIRCRAALPFPYLGCQAPDRPKKKRDVFGPDILWALLLRI